MSLIQDIRAFFEWRNKDRDECIIATAEYITTIVDNNLKPTGEEHTHILSFWIDGNCKRWSLVSSTDNILIKRHKDVLIDKLNWRIHGDLPEHARRIDGAPRGKLLSINGGKGAV